MHHHGTKTTTGKELEFAGNDIPTQPLFPAGPKTLATTSGTTASRRSPLLLFGVPPATRTVSGNLSAPPDAQL